MTRQANSSDRRSPRDTARGLWRSVSELLRVVAHALILALLVRTFLYQPFNIPSGSMMNTLLIGDYLFVSKFSYGYSRFSLPFSLPLFSGRFFSDEPERGDVAVFRLPRDTSVDYIKRVIGLPGDQIQMIDGALHINGEPAGRERVADAVVTLHGQQRRIHRYRETLPNGVSYFTLDDGNRPLDNTRVYVVPEGHYFMMGDNRDNSQDSRVWDKVGPVPLENFIGRAQIIFFSVDDEAPLGVRWGRLLDLVD